ncbi:MAG: carboxymethylenebutenolidase [Betaproteobacteria bacterium RIFCSPLOWO2_12_FULL_62_58]|nr:MAG: carboxymethylenebutenolidase [Betaproteobacteria bacterium RIFCSPLOWO2_12_FULL_62_58]
MDQKIIDLYDEYTHAPLERRVFLARLAGLTGSAAAALSLVPLIESNYARAATVPTDDRRLDIGRTTYLGATGEIKAYMVRPKGAAKLPAVIVIHENRGLNAHIEDVTRRVALEGFFALAPDLLTPLGGTPADEDAARDMIGKLDRKQMVQNAVSAVPFLKKHANGNGKVGVVGFCWGGSPAGQVAVDAPDLDAVVVYYGQQPNASEVEKIRAPLLLHYASLDARINAGIPAFVDALKKANKNYAMYMYEGANHAFNNDTSEARYHKQAAEQAWSRTIAFFKENLKA